MFHLESLGTVRIQDWPEVPFPKEVTRIAVTGPNHTEKRAAVL